MEIGLINEIQSQDRQIRQGYIKMKVGCIFLALCCIKLAVSTCMNNCLTCPNATVCTTCMPGYFVSANSNCQPCPSTCTACTVGSTGSPNCTACISSAQLSVSDGKCYVCDPSCSGCVNQPYNCTSCKLGLIIQTINSTNSCITDTNCTFANCAACATSNGQLICQTCMPGYFQLNSACFPCKFPALTCTFDTTSIWNNYAYSFWYNAASQLYPNYPSNPSTVPSYFNSMNFNTMNSLSVSRWTYAYLVYQTFAPYLSASQNNIVQILSDAVSFIQAIPSNYNNSQSLNSMLVHLISTYSLSTYSITAQNILTLTGAYANKYIAYSSCAVGYYYDSTSSQLCVNCKTHCLQCTSGTTCTTCQDGYYLHSNGCYACDSNCNKCVYNNINANLNSICTQCKLPYTYETNTMQCLLCATPCLTCAPANPSFCYSCRSPFSLTPNYYGQCHLCTQLTCLNCLPSNTSTCLQCMQQYTVISGRCYKCLQNCQTCSILSNWRYVCHICNSGYSLVNNSCTQCSYGCQQCAQYSPSLCIQCMDGLYLSMYSHSCIVCPPQCLTCSSQLQCTVYKQQVTVYSNISATCRQGCSICKPSNPQLCTQCADRYYYQVSTQTCLPCASNCLQCTSSIYCIQCVDTYYMLGNQCYACADTNCRLCNSSNNAQCMYCNRAYMLNTNNVCVSVAVTCAYNCIACVNSSNAYLCTQCMQGYTLLGNGTCVRCVRNCSGTCLNTNVTSCVSCIDSYYLYDNQCHACAAGCRICPDSQCNQCLPAYQLKQSSSGVLSCSYVCRQPCMTCSYTSCLSCITGYVLSSASCIVSSYINTSPAYCPTGTYNTDTTYATHQCVSCISYCSYCDNPNSCYICRDGYYLSNTNQCSACPAQCYTCYDSTKCITCANGYLKQIISYTNTYNNNNNNNIAYSDSCIKCNINCLTCSITLDRCTSCPTNYYLYNQRCIFQYTVFYNYTLNYDYYTFVNNVQSQLFLTALATLLNVTITNIYIDFILAGSTLIGGRISGNSLQHVTDLSNILTNTSLPYFNVLSTSATAYLYNTQILQTNYQNDTIDTPQQPTPFNYVPIIIVIVVGTFVVLFIIVLIVVRWINSRNQMMQLRESSSSLDASKTTGQSKADISIEDLQPTEKKRLRIRKRRL